MNTTNKKVQNDVSWNTKFYVLLAGLMAAMAFFKSTDESNILKGSLIALFIVTIVDLLEIIYHRYTSAWKIIKILFVVGLFILVLIG